MDKPAGEYHNRGKNRREHLQSNCKVCQRELADIWKAKYKDKVQVHNKRAHLKRFYSMSLEEFEDRKSVV